MLLLSREASKATRRVPEMCSRAYLARGHQWGGEQSPLIVLGGTNTRVLMIQLGVKRMSWRRSRAGGTASISSRREWRCGPCVGNNDHVAAAWRRRRRGRYSDISWQIIVQAPIHVHKIFLQLNALDSPALSISAIAAYRTTIFRSRDGASTIVPPMPRRSTVRRGPLGSIGQ